jgi:hypothetical protein
MPETRTYVRKFTVVTYTLTPVHYIIFAVGRAEQNKLRQGYSTMMDLSDKPYKRQNCKH